MCGYDPFSCCAEPPVSCSVSSFHSAPQKLRECTITNVTIKRASEVADTHDDNNASQRSPVPQQRLCNDLLRHFETCFAYYEYLRMQWGRDPISDGEVGLRRRQPGGTSKVFHHGVRARAYTLQYSTFSTFLTCAATGRCSDMMTTVG